MEINKRKIIKAVVVIQGPSDYVHELKLAWAGFDLIWSTWRGDESKYYNNDVVIFNDKPTDPGTGNIVWQKLTTLEGIKKAKELGYTHVFKWRSDMIPNNSKKLFELLDHSALNFLAWHDGGYFVDYFSYGPIQDMTHAWEFSESDGSFAEQILTKNIWKNQLTKFHFFVHKLTTDIDIFWAKYKVSMLSYQQHPCYATTKLNKADYGEE